MKKNKKNKKGVERSSSLSFTMNYSNQVHGPLSSITFHPNGEHPMDNMEHNMEHNMEDISARFQFTPQEEEAFYDIKFPVEQFIPKRKKNVEQFKDHYKLGKLVGTGAFGKVYSCIHNTTGLVRAAKIVSKNSGVETGDADKDSKERKKRSKTVKKEFEILTQLDHPNLCKVYELFEDDDQFWIILDYYDNKRDLFDVVRRQGAFTPNQVAFIMKRLLCCVSYCHHKNIVHRDLKLENVLLDTNDIDDLKLIDFGLAKQVDNPNKTFYDVGGSCAYISPQMINGEYNRGCDIWALGVCAYVLLTGQLPFAAETDKDVIHKIDKGEVDFHSHDVFRKDHECVRFVSALLTYKEEDRPTATDLLTHPWLEQQTNNRKANENNANADPDLLRKEALLLDKEIKSALRAMRRFESRKVSKLKQATGAIIAAQYLKPEQRQRIDVVFRALDCKCCGCLSIEDLQCAFFQYLDLQGTTQQLEELIQPIISYDPQWGAVVKYSEFAAIFALEGRKFEWLDHAQQLVRAVYQYLDQDNKGYITPPDLQTHLYLSELSTMSESSSRIMIAEVTNSPFISRNTFERAILGRKRASSSAQLIKSFTKSVDHCQDQAQSIARNLGNYVQAFMRK